MDKPGGLGAPISPLRLLRWVPFETISDLVVEAETQFAIWLDEMVWRRVTVNIACAQDY